MAHPIAERVFAHPDRAATSAIERPSSRTVAVASRCNSGGYFDGRPRDRVVLDMDFLQYGGVRQRGCSDFSSLSFGFRPKRSAHAMNTIMDETWQGRLVVVEADIARSTARRSLTP